MTGKIGYFSRDFFLTIAGMICIGGLPALFNGIQIEFTAYISALKDVVSNLADFRTLTYKPSPLGEPELTRPMFPEILEPFGYSLTLIVLTFMVSFIVALAAGCIVVLGGRKRINRSLYAASLFEGIPDLFIIIMIQLGVVVFYQKTGVLLLDFVPMLGDKIYVLPVLLLSIIPTVYLFRILVQLFAEEFEKDYATLAVSKGRSPKGILLVHVLRNTLVALSSHMRPFIWLMLSNLFVVEYMLGIHGMTRFMTMYLSPVVITVSLMLLYIPFFILFVILDNLATRWNAKEGA